MRTLATAAVVLAISLLGRLASADETLDWPLPEGSTRATVRAGCASSDDPCAVMRTRCEEWQAAGIRGMHGSNTLMVCDVLGLPIVDADLVLEEHDEIVQRCTSDPQGAYCKSIRATCLRNRDESWPLPMIEATCRDAAKAGATWEIDAGLVVDVPDQGIDGPWINVAAIHESCAAGSAACAETRAVCEGYIALAGGYIYLSHDGDMCRAVGVAGPTRDLLASELYAVQTWCPKSPGGPACTSLQHICDIYGTSDQTNSYPNLLAACQLMASVHGGSVTGIGTSGSAEAKPPKPPEPPTPGVTDLLFGLAVGRVAEPAQLDDTTTTLAVDLRTHGKLGLSRAGTAVSVTAAAGSTTGGGLLYDLTLGFGVGVRVGADGMLAVTAGAGFGGITGGRLGFAWQVPIEVYAGLPIGRALRVMLGARGTWVFKEDPRQDGAASVTVFDEVEGRVGVALRRKNGLLWGLYGFASQVRDTNIVGLALAFGQALVETGAPKEPR